MQWDKNRGERQHQDRIDRWFVDQRFFDDFADERVKDHIKTAQDRVNQDESCAPVDMPFDLDQAVAEDGIAIRQR